MSEYVYDMSDANNPLREEIVRCRDCRHYVDASPRSTRYRIKGPRCLLFSDNKVVRVKPDGYCAWACRNEGGE